MQEYSTNVTSARNCSEEMRNPHICTARREDYTTFVMATGEKGEAAAAVLDKFMNWAEREKCHENIVFLSDEAYREKFENCVGRPPVGQFIDPTQRKRTQPSLPYNGKYRRLSESSRSSSSSRTSISATSSSSLSSLSAVYGSPPYLQERRRSDQK